MQFILIFALSFFVVQIFARITPPLIGNRWSVCSLGILNIRARLKPAIECILRPNAKPIMKDSTSTKVVPADFDECSKFLSEHRSDIARGLYDLQLEKDWVRELSESDILLVAQSCPSSRLAIASITKSTDILQFLSEDFSGDVREAVADNPKTPASILVTLAGDSFSSVRMAVAANPKTPESSLEKLAGDSINYVRWGVAHNESTPPHVLKSLTKDSDKHVSDEARNNPRAPKASWLARLLGKG